MSRVAGQRASGDTSNASANHQLGRIGQDS